MKNHVSISGLILFLACLTLSSPPAEAAEQPFSFKSFDGYPLPAKCAHPAGTKDSTTTRVVILIHGSGPHNMDSALTRATRKKKKNLLFVDVKNALVGKGFTVIRFDKRSYRMRMEIIGKKPGYKKRLAQFQAASLLYLVDDVKALAAYARKRFAKAKIYLMGFSQGTYIALQVAHQDKQIAGVVLIGFYTSTLLTAAYEQILYRPLTHMHPIDTNRDGKLSKAELKKGGKVGRQLLPQLKILDVDKDGQLSMTEIKGGNILHLFRFYRAIPRSYVIQEAKYPHVVKIIQQSKFKIAFFQGMLDNQTPAYHAIGIRLINLLRWKKKNLRFQFFPGLGHILDRRKSYLDLLFNPIDPKALSSMATKLSSWFK